jgi:hypothetical protein
MNDVISPWSGRVAAAAVVSAALAIACGLIPGPAHRAGLLAMETAVAMTLFAAIPGLLSLVAGAALLIVFRRETLGNRRVQAFLAIAVGLIVCGVFVAWIHKATSLPPIHDLSTDTSDPPAFDALLSYRLDAANPPDYPGEKTAELQSRAYPDVATLYTSVSCEGVLAAAEAVALRMGWEVVASSEGDGSECRLEAMAQTRWFGFRDDIVVRGRDNGYETAVDVRAKARTGVSDLGRNAATIVEFNQRLQAELGE